MVDFVLEIHRKLSIFSTKMTISHKIKIAKIGKLMFHSFQNIAELFGPKKIAIFEGEEGGFLRAVN